MFTQLHNQTGIMVELHYLKVGDNKCVLKFFLCMSVLNVLLQIFIGLSPVANHCISFSNIFLHQMYLKFRYKEKATQIKNNNLFFLKLFLKVDSEIFSIFFSAFSEYLNITDLNRKHAIEWTYQTIIFEKYTCNECG